MTDLKVETVKVGPVEKHPNADTLSIAKVYDFLVVIRTGDFKEGDTAIYIPVDSMVNTDRPEFAFLKSHEKRNRERIKAKKIRGVFSMGMLIPINPMLTHTGDWAMDLEITKYEEPEPLCDESIKDNGKLVGYTNIDSLRRYNDIFNPGEQVIVTEKVHGANGRWMWDGTEMHAGSHHMMKKPGTSMWWKAIEPYAEKLKAFPNFQFFGEVYGQVQDLKYGMNSGFKILFFDVFDKVNGRYVDFDTFYNLCINLHLPMVPVLYNGPYSKEVIAELAEKDSAVCPGQLMEGVVVRPVVERWNPTVGRVILKYHSERYLTRKGGTERK